MPQQHNTTLKWEKKQHSNTAKTWYFMPTYSERNSPFFKEKFWRKKKIGGYLHLCNDFVPSCASLNMQVKEKKRKTASFFHEEKSCPSRAEASSYFFVFCQLAWEAYYPGVRHTFPKGRENRQGRQSIKKADT